MGLLDALFGGLFGDDDSSEEEVVVERPCSNCPGDCSIAPDACSVCQPYKEQMIDAIYRVEHKDEIISRYEVTGTAVSEGAVVCPYCGGHSENHYVCEYCGSKLQEGTGKIQVASAADIPNPVLEAQDIIFSRYEAVKNFAGADEAYGLVDALSGIGSEGLLSSIFGALMGDSDTNDSKTLGNKMTESEIKEMADFYNVSISEYLTGLDNGKYLTMSNKKTAAAAEEKYSRERTETSSSGSMLGDLSGLAGALGLGSILFGGNSYNYSAARRRPGATYRTVTPNTRPQSVPNPRQQPPVQPRTAAPKMPEQRQSAPRTVSSSRPVQQSPVNRNQAPSRTPSDFGARKTPQGNTVSHNKAVSSARTSSPARTADDAISRAM